MTPGPIDDERLHRGDSDLVGVEPEPPESPAPEIAPPPVTNSGLAARAEIVRADRAQRRGREAEDEAEPELGPREFVGDLPPLPPPPGAPRELTAADEPDDPAAPAEPPADTRGGDDPGDPGDAWSQPSAPETAAPPVPTGAIADGDSWLAPRPDKA